MRHLIQYNIQLTKPESLNNAISKWNSLHNLSPCFFNFRTVWVQQSLRWKHDRFFHLCLKPYHCFQLVPNSTNNLFRTKQVSLFLCYLHSLHETCPFQPLIGTQTSWIYCLTILAWYYQHLPGEHINSTPISLVFFLLLLFYII